MGDDFNQLIERLPAVLQWLYSTPWWVPAILASCLTIFLIVVSWPREPKAIPAPPKTGDPRPITVNIVSREGRFRLYLAQGEKGRSVTVYSCEEPSPVAGVVRVNHFVWAPAPLSNINLNTVRWHAQQMHLEGHPAAGPVMWLLEDYARKEARVSPPSRWRASKKVHRCALRQMAMKKR